MCGKFLVVHGSSSLTYFIISGLPSFASRDDESQDYFEWNTEGIDWDRVAEKVTSYLFPKIKANDAFVPSQVSSVVSLPRTARDCAIRWLGDRHPRFIRDSWSQTELDRLESFVNNTPEGPIDWAEIANKLGVKFSVSFPSLRD